MYATNAEAVTDYLKNYTDEQINTIGEMTSNENNMALAQWKDKAEKLRAKGEASLESGGEMLGGILGIKGIGKGISKVRALYKKAQDAKKAAQALAKKGQQALDEGKQATKNIQQDVVQKSQSKNDKAKQDYKEGDEDLPTEPEPYYTTPYDDVDTSEHSASKDNEGMDDPVNQQAESDTKPISIDELENMNEDELTKFIQKNTPQTDGDTKPQNPLA